MVFFLTSVLVVSSLAMIVLLYARHWELATGHVILAEVRPRIGAFFDRVLVFAEKHLPALVILHWKRAIMWGYAAVRSIAARTILVTERLLERALLWLRRVSNPPHHEGGGQASVFLREVAAYKKTLMRRSRKIRATLPE